MPESGHHRGDQVGGDLKLDPVGVIESGQPVADGLQPLEYTPVNAATGLASTDPSAPSLALLKCLLKS